LGEGDEFDVDADEYVCPLCIPPPFPSPHRRHVLICALSDDEPLRGPVQELDLGSGSEDDEDEEPPQVAQGKNMKKSKQLERPRKIIPTGSDLSSSEEEEGDEEDDEERVTMANMEARSRALDARALAEAEVDAAEQQAAARAEEPEEGDEDLDVDLNADDDGEGSGERFVLPTPEEIEAERKGGGPDVQVVQLRMRECVKVLGNFRTLGAKGRLVFICISLLLGSLVRVMLMCMFVPQVKIGVHGTIDLGHC
jgi:hypothetical protein